MFSVIFDASKRVSLHCEVFYFTTKIKNVNAVSNSVGVEKAMLNSLF